MNKLTVLFLLIFFFISTAFSFKTYNLELSTYSRDHFTRLTDLIGITIDSVDVPVHEFDNLNEFTQTTGAPFFICAFTTKEGVFIQSRYLLGNKFEDSLIHELIHYTIKSEYPVPKWFEEGLVCLVTGELEDGSPIAPMNNVEEFDILEADNNWELTSYALGCAKKVKELLDEN